MLTRADEIKKCLELLGGTIGIEEKQLEEREERLKAHRAYLDQLYARRMMLEGQLAREQAPLQMPTGKCVMLESNGVEWKV